MKTKVIFDTSALLALIHETEGSEILKPLLYSSVISVISLDESLQHLQKSGIPSKESLTLIQNIITDIAPFDSEQALFATELSSHPTLSFSDRACLALGMKLQLPIYTANQKWTQLQLDNLDINVI